MLLSTSPESAELKLLSADTKLSSLSLLQLLSNVSSSSLSLITITSVASGSAAEHRSEDREINNTCLEQLGKHLPSQLA